MISILVYYVMLKLANIFKDELAFIDEKIENWRDSKINMITILFSHQLLPRHTNGSVTRHL